jgi:hypothetical protein
MLEQEVPESREAEEVMSLFAVLCPAAANLTDGILDLSRLQVATASHVALVSPGGLAAVGTLPFHISIRQEALAFGAIGKIDLPGIDVAVLHESFYHLFGAIVASRIVSIAKEVEINLHSLEDLIEVLVILDGQSLGGHSLSLGIDHDRGSMGIRAADEEHLFAHLSQSSDEDVRWYIGS